MKIIKLKYITITLYFIISILASCSKDTTYFRVGDGEISTDGDTTLIEPIIRIKLAKYNLPSRSSTELYDTIPHDRYMHIYFYKSGDDPSNSRHHLKGIYRTLKNGSIVPLYNKVSLSKGKYDIYILSVINNEIDQLPRFDNYLGVSDYVYNGLDYVWG